MYSRYFKLLFLLLCSTAYTFTARAQANYTKIENYKVYYGVAKHFPQEWMVLRQFDNYGKNYVLLVNPQTLETKTDESSFYQITPMTMLQARAFFKNTPYQNALAKAEK